MKHFVRFLVFFLFTNIFCEPQQREPGVIKFDVNAQPVGTIEFTGKIDILNEKFSLTGQFKEDKKLEWGPLKINNELIALSNDKGLTITADASFFNKTGTIGLKELSTDKIVLGITLKEPLQLYVTPSEKISLSDVDLVLITGKEPIIQAQTNIFGTNCTIQFSTKKSEVVFAFDTIKIANITPEIQLDLAIRNAQITVSNVFTKDKPPAFNVSGILDMSKIFPGVQNVSVSSTISSSATGKVGAAFSATLPSDWTVGKIVPGLEFEDATLWISSIDFIEPSFGTEIKKGVGFSASLKQSGPVERLAKLSNKPGQKLRVYGTIGALPKDFRISAPIPMGIEFNNPNFKSSSLILEISGEPSFATLFQLEVKPTPQDAPITLTMRMKLDPISAGIATTAKGVWQDPFGIKGLKIEDFALQASVNYATGIPTELGFAGKLILGTKQVETQTLLSLDPQKSFVAGKLNSLGFSDLFMLLNTMGAKIDTSTIPDIGLKDVEIKIAPVGGKIGEITVEKGLSVKGSVELLGAKGNLNISISETGLIGEGSLTPINILGGLLRIEGSGGSAGPIISIALTPEKQHFIIHGSIFFFGLFEETDIVISKDGFFLEIEGKIWELFNAIASAKTSGDIHKPNFEINLKIKNDFFTFIETHVDNAMNEMISKAKTDISKAQADVTKAQDEVKKLDTQIQTIMDENMRNINKAQADVNKLQADIDRTQREIDRENALPPLQPRWNLIWLGPQKLGLIIAKGVADGALEVARKLHVLDPRITGLAIARTIAFGTLESAKGILEAAKGGAIVVGEAIKLGTRIWETSTIIGATKIKRAEVSTSLQKFISGELPKFEADIEFAPVGQKVFSGTIVFNIDLKDPSKFFVQLVNGIINGIIGVKK